MTGKTLTCALVVFITGVNTPAWAADQSQADAEIRRVQMRQQEAWNRHDARAYAALFTEDADCVNVVGWWWKGRRQIEERLTAGYALVFRESILTIDDVQVRFLTANMAVAHVHWSMIGARTPPGIPEPRVGIQTQVLQKRGGKWLIAAFQNTNSVPETPFPTKSPDQNSTTERLSPASSERTLPWLCEPPSTRCRRDGV
jgi:uncharacterized protein (TIGR02246 family)